ncbi:uncharacterized protein [Rutidosis leptorrhynchoides]|uniref:uncharacterized protein n=1 Tax=Rutidosis leptorrhynchoides TaxID=125765 RepID=UPI003A996061
MVDTIISGMLTVLMEKLNSEEIFGSKLDKLKITLARIQPLLADACKKYITDRTVKVWLEDLQHLAYDIEDLLDEMATGGNKEELLRMLLRDEACKSNFVSIVDVFDVFNISLAIYQSVSGVDRKFYNLNELQWALSEKLSKKRFLIVLDDVCSENYSLWKLLNSPFLTGAPGSRIIVTSLKEMVARMMDSTHIFCVNLSSYHESLSLFAQHAQVDINILSQPQHERVIDAILNKCKRMPIALVMLGRYFSYRTNVEEWDEELKSELWNLREDDQWFLPTLKICYYDLSPRLNQMFAYCSIFPKDYDFYADECSEDKSRYTMHDLVYDVTMSVAGEFLCVVESDVIIGGDNGLKISELKNLSHLHGMKKTEYQVLEKLNPHNELKTLKIMFYGGVKFPSWVGDQSFVQLTELTLRGCEHRTQLPSLRHLRALKKLFVESMNKVVTIGPELLGFPLLKVLEFKDMEGWEKWFINSDETWATKSYACLHEISLVNYMKLKVESKQLIPSLKVLHIQKCSTQVLQSMVGLSSSVVTLTVEDIVWPQLPVQVLENLVAVENLSIKCCDDMRFLWKSGSNTSNFLTSLQKLEVSFGKMLVTIVDKDVSMESVKEVNIHDCERLNHYECPNSIERIAARINNVAGAIDQ